MPGPLSDTSSRAIPPSSSTVTTIREPAGVWRSELSSSALSDLPHARVVTAGVDLARTEVGGNAGSPARGDPAQLTHAVLGDPGELHVLVRDGDAARIQAREVEQVGRELRKAVTCSRIVARKPSRARRVGIVLRGELEEPAERRKRRAQLVRGVRDELLPGVLEPAERTPHRVERACQVGDLVAALVDDRVVEGAGRRSARRRLGVEAAGQR